MFPQSIAMTTSELAGWLYIASLVGAKQTMFLHLVTLYTCKLWPPQGTTVN